MKFPVQVSRIGECPENFPRSRSSDRWCNRPLVVSLHTRTAVSAPTGFSRLEWKSVPRDRRKLTPGRYRGESERRMSFLTGNRPRNLSIWKCETAETSWFSRIRRKWRQQLHLGPAFLSDFAWHVHYKLTLHTISILLRFHIHNEWTCS